MSRSSVSVLTSAGARLYYVQREHESVSEFHGRYRCEIESRISGSRPVPKGTRWAEWDHDGHPLGKFYAHGLGTVYESTGERYADRWVRIPGAYGLDAARAAIKAQPLQPEEPVAAHAIPESVTWIDRALSTEGSFDPARGYVLCELDGEHYAVSGRYAGLPDDDGVAELVADLHLERFYRDEVKLSDYPASLAAWTPSVTIIERIEAAPEE